MRTLSLLTGIFLVVGPVRAADKYEVDPVHSAVLFKIQHAGAGHVWGRFTGFTGSISLDAADPAKSSVEFSVKSDSVLTDNEKRDQHLKSPDFLNVRQFPALTFKSAAVKVTGPTSAEVTGELTLHGVAKSVTAQVKRTGAQGDLVGFEATFAIQRSQYGMGWGVGQGLGDEVQIVVAAEAKKK